MHFGAAVSSVFYSCSNIFQTKKRNFLKKKKRRGLLWQNEVGLVAFRCVECFRLVKTKWFKQEKQQLEQWKQPFLPASENAGSNSISRCPVH